MVRNTIDMEQQIRLHDELRAFDATVIRGELGLRDDTVVLLFVGRIYEAKRVDALIDAVRALNAGGLTDRFETVIVGDGPSAPAVRAAAAGIDNIRFTGAIEDQGIVARYLRIASAVVVPGKLGLVVNHAVAHGVPVISQVTDAHSPEVEYLTSGKDSILVTSHDELTATLRETISNPDRLRQLSVGALETRRRLSLSAMVDSFQRGVQRAVAARRR